MKSHRFVRRGRIVTAWDAAQRQLCTTYTNGDFERTFLYCLRKSGTPPGYANGRVVFEIELQPAAAWHTCCHYELAGRPSERGCYLTETAETEVDRLQHDWQERTTQLTSTNEDVYRLYRQSVEDMGALRLHDQDFAPDVWLAAAGVPWFVAVFGRAPV